MTPEEIEKTIISWLARHCDGSKREVTRDSPFQGIGSFGEALPIEVYGVNTSAATLVDAIIMVDEKFGVKFSVGHLIDIVVAAVGGRDCGERA